MGTYNALTVFTAQLSDTAGSFTSPINIGSTSANKSTIECVIPANTFAGSEYRIRVVAANPSQTGSDNGTDITISNAPIAVYRINAGGGQVSNSIGTFAADTFYAAGTNTTTYADSTTILGTADGEIYKSERFGPNNILNYSFPVANGNYNVILHFAEVYFTAAGKRVFDVSIEGNKVLDDYDIFRKAGASKATTEAFPVTVTDGMLNIDFSSLPANGGVDQPKISAIEVLNTGPNAVVNSFTLVNAANNTDIQNIINGSVLNLAALPGRSVNIRANTSPANVDSVLFNLVGAQVNTVTEKVFPFALFGDNGGAYNSWTPGLGSYTLTATPYIGGMPGIPLSISFYIVNKPVDSIVSRKGLATPDEAINQFYANTFKIYPNPNATGNYTVALPKPVEGNVSYTLVTTQGTRLAGGMLILTKPTSSLHFNFSREIMSSGEYYLILQGKDMKGQIKLMRMK